MSVTYNFSGKRVLVTGGAKGLGAAVVSKFVAAGATVIALDRDGTALAALKASHPTVITVTADLLDWDKSRAAVEALGGPIHHLVNNAGIPEVVAFTNMTSENVDRIFGVNFKACINMGQVMAKGLEKHGVTTGGTIVNVSSIMDNRTVPGAGLYCCTKAAVTMLAKVMALELAPQKIRVNVVRPTLMATELIPQNTEYYKQVAEGVLKFCLERQITKRLLTVEETANAILYLSSDASEMCNGSGILVDGGLCTS